MINTAGLDGCKSGWLIFYYQDNQYQFQLINSILDATTVFERSHKIFVDVPIGLSSLNYNRLIEKQMRKLLKNRSSTVFTPPCREALEQKDYLEANQKNRQITGKGLSKQAFNIGKKILEVDGFLKTDRNFKLIESHPEICFKILSGKVLQTKKNTFEGQLERRKIISNLSIELDKTIAKALKTYPKSEAQPDDIIDAAVLCLSAQISLSFNSLVWKDFSSIDENGIEVKIETGETQ